MYYFKLDSEGHYLHAKYIVFKQKNELRDDLEVRCVWTWIDMFEAVFSINLTDHVKSVIQITEMRNDSIVLSFATL